MVALAFVMRFEANLKRNRVGVLVGYQDVGHLHTSNRRSLADRSPIAGALL